MARQWKQGSIDGGGYITAVAIDPFGSGTVVCGGDVSGTHVSQNFGRRWADRNNGRASTNGLKIACLKWHPAVKGTVYACVGFSGIGAWSGFYRSTDYGYTWSLLSSDVKFSANRNAASEIPSPWPRSTGNLLEFVGSTMYAGTFKDGLFRSTDGGQTWTAIALTGGGHYIRGITQDPGTPHRLFVTTYLETGGGVYCVDNADTFPIVTQLTQSPSETEEITVIGSTLYAASGTGIYAKAANPTNDAWTLRYDDGSKWTEITGYVDGGDTVLYAGAYKAALGSNGKYNNVMRSTDGGQTWSDFLQSATISTVSYERENPWWLAAANPLSMFGAKRYTVTQIAIDPNDRSRIIVAGTHGVWSSEDGGANWRPAIRELGATINQVIAVSGNHAIASDADWGFVRSSNLFLSTTGLSGKEIPKDGFSAVSDGTDWYVGSGDRRADNLGGSIYKYSNFTTLSRDSKWDLAGATLSAQDDFARTVSNGWGSATTGGAWTAVSGANNRLAVSSGVATIDASQDNTLHQQQLNGLDMTDSYAETTVKFSAVPTGGWIEARIVLRAEAAAASYYSSVLRLDPTGAVTLYIRKFNGSTYIIDQQQVTANYTAGDTLYFSAFISGNSIKAYGQVLSDGADDIVSSSYTDDGVSRGAVLASGAPGLAATRQSGSSGAVVSFGLCEWQSPSDTGIAGAWPVGIAVGADAGGDKTLIAAAHGRGIWRKNVETDSAWTRVSDTIGMTQSSNQRLPIAWSSIHSDTVWAFDLAEGVYRSTDHGDTWSLIWAATGDTDYFRGWLAADPTDGEVLWAVTDSGLYKLTNARTGTLAATKINDVNSAGPLAVAEDGTVYVVDITDGSPEHPPRLWRSTDHGASWVDIADATFRSIAIIPRALAAKSDGTVLLATNGNGVLVYAPVATKQTIV